MKCLNSIFDFHRIERNGSSPIHETISRSRWRKRRFGQWGSEQVRPFLPGCHFKTYKAARVQWMTRMMKHWSCNCVKWPYWPCFSPNTGKSKVGKLAYRRWKFTTFSLIWLPMEPKPQSPSKLTTSLRKYLIHTKLKLSSSLLSFRIFFRLFSSPSLSVRG